MIDIDTEFKSDNKANENLDEIKSLFESNDSSKVRDNYKQGLPYLFKELLYVFNIKEKKIRWK